MFRLLLSRARPVVRRFLSAPGPLVLYPLLAGLLAWGAVHSGWQSSGAAGFGFPALFFGLIAAREWRACVTGVGFY